jgi:hypothetical protein
MIYPSLLQKGSSLIFLLSVLLSSCSRSTTTPDAGQLISVIEPDYTGVTIPPNIAPLNFKIAESGSKYRVRAESSVTGYTVKINSANGIIKFPGQKWKRLLAESTGDSIKMSLSYKTSDATKEHTFKIYVASDSIDAYLAYRLIPPGYYSWSRIRIMQRSLESFREEALFDNQVMDKNCANCHSFSNSEPDRFMIHVRGSLGGTYLFDNDSITRVEPKIDAMPGGATYPAWHPGGEYIAFSSNQVRQSFYSVPDKSIEVFDLVSSLVLYNIGKNETFMIDDQDTVRYMPTFPSWSPDGKYLYFCRAKQVIDPDDPTLEQIKNTRYDLVRKAFDPLTGVFGPAELIFGAASLGKSVSFPRVSPDGRFIIFTLHDYGTFPIWHSEADLYIQELSTGIVLPMTVNSKETDSYHTFSENGRWLVFSSKRTDGRTSRPHFAYLRSDGTQGKPFILPQKDPERYFRMIESFNIPEFVNGKIKFSPHDMEEASQKEILVARPGNKTEGRVPDQPINKKINDDAKAIHE